MGIYVLQYMCSCPQCLWTSSIRMNISLFSSKLINQEVINFRPPEFLWWPIAILLYKKGNNSVYKNKKCNKTSILFFRMPWHSQEIYHHKPLHINVQHLWDNMSCVVLSSQQRSHLPKELDATCQDVTGQKIKCGPSVVFVVGGCIFLALILPQNLVNMCAPFAMHSTSNYTVYCALNSECF